MPSLSSLAASTSPTCEVDLCGSCGVRCRNMCSLRHRKKLSSVCSAVCRAVDSLAIQQRTRAIALLELHLIYTFNFSCRHICGRYEILVTDTETRPRTWYTFIIDPDLIYTFNFSCRHICGRYEKLVTDTETRPRTWYTVASDPVSIYTCKVLNEKIIVYTRTGSLATVYTVIIDPVLTHTFNFSCKVLFEKIIVYMRTGSLGTACV